MVFDKSQFEGVLRENPELAEYIAHLEELASKNGLSGLFNQRRFHEDLPGFVDFSYRSGLPVSLAYIDLDIFKQMNDAYGHPEGDRVIKQVGSVLRENIRESDRAYRIGGDEFALILPSSKSFTPADNEKLAKDLEGRFYEQLKNILVGGNQFLSVSIGLATYPLDVGVRSCDNTKAYIARASKELKRVADGRLYQAKDMGEPPKISYGQIPLLSGSE